MIDPISIAVSVTLFSAFSLVSYKMGRRAENRSNLGDPEGNASLKKEIEGASSRIKELEYQLSNYKTWYGGMKRAAETHVREKEQFKELALSHEVKWPEPPKVQFEKTKVWDKRRYSNHPSANLKALSADLKEFKGKEVNMVLDLRPCGGWKEIVSKKGYRDENFFKKMAFEGPPERVIEEITAFFKDHDMPFMSRSNHPSHPVHEQGPFGTQLRWDDTDSAVVMQIDMTITERIEPAQKPEIHYVKVPVIETRTEVIERIVEKVTENPVVDNEHLAALVEVAVQEQLAKRALRKASESTERLPQERARQAQGTGG